MTIIIPRPGESLADLKKRFAESERRLLEGGDGARDSRLRSRALNPCGQDEDGEFAKGNTCAAGGGDAKAAAVPKGRVRSSEYGMRFDARNESVVRNARSLSDAQWNTHPVQVLPHGTTLEANEDLLKTAPIEKVVSGQEPFREGYVTKLFRDSEGRLHVVDGHHRVAMYHALKRDMPVRILDEKDVESLRIPDVQFAATADSDAFAAGRDKSAHPGFLSSHTPRELDAFDKRLAEGGKVGYMIDPKTGDFGNLFNNGGTKGAGKAAVVDAIRNGAKTLDCFDGFLPSFYAKAGWTPVARYKFVDEYAPATWDYEAHGRPDVIVMAYTGGDRATIAERYGTFPAYSPVAGYSTEEFDDAKRRARELSEAADAANPGGADGQPGSSRSAVDGGAGSGRRGGPRPPHLDRAGRGNASDSGPVDFRSLNSCGQEKDGTFAVGNTCAAGGGSSTSSPSVSPLKAPAAKKSGAKKSDKAAAAAAAASTPSAAVNYIERVERAIRDGFSADGNIDYAGSDQVWAVRRALFDGGHSPSEVLGAYGWRGDGSDIDGISPTSGGGFAKIVEGIDGDTPEARESRRTAVAGFLAGLGYSIQSHSHDYPSIREVAVRAISRDQAGAEAEAEFRKNYEHLVVDNPNENTSPLALSRAEFQVALAQAVANAKAPVAYYDARTMRITAIVDNLMSPDAQEAAYQQGGMSAPSMMHTGYHEAVHAAHAAAVSEAAGIRTSGGPLSDKEIEKFLKAREGKILGVMKDMLKNPERWKISKGAASMTQSEMQDYVVKAIVRSSSFYGASNPNETIAEYATAVALGGAEPNEAMDELYEAFTGMRPPAPPKHLTPMTVDQRKNRNARVESVVGPPPILTFGPGEP